MEWPQYTIIAWILVGSVARIAMANGWKPEPSGPGMLVWQATGLRILLVFILIEGGFFPSPF